MEQCEKEACHKEAVSLVARPAGDIMMCWECLEDYRASEADMIELQMVDR